MSQLNEGPGASTGNDDQLRSSKRQSRFQGHWDAAANANQNTPQLQFHHVNVSNSHPPAASNNHKNYSWDLLVSSSKPTTPATAMGIQTFTDPIDDDWSSLLDQSGSPASASSNRAHGYQGIGFGRIGIEGSKINSVSAGIGSSGAVPSIGESPGVSSRPRRQLVDIIQNDFPRTPSPAIVDSSNMRMRSSNTPLQNQGTAESGDAAAALESHSLDANPSAAAAAAVSAGSHQGIHASSAFSSLPNSAPNRNPVPVSSSGLLSDTNILGIPARKPSVAPPSRSHSTIMLSSSNDAPNVGLMLNSLLDQEDDPGHRHSQVDIFGMSVGSPPNSSAAPSGQSLWAARHAARLDGLQRAASTPPRNNAAASGAGAGAGPSSGQAISSSLWGGMDLGAGQQSPAALLRESNNLLMHGSSSALPPPVSLNITSGQMGADDLSYRIRGLHIAEDGNRLLRSAEPRGSHGIFGDSESPSTVVHAHGPINSAGDHWDFGSQFKHQLQQQPLLQSRMYESNLQHQSQLRLHASQTAVSASAAPPFVENIVTDRNVLYSNNNGLSTAGIPMHSAGMGPGPGTAPHAFSRAQSYNDNRYLRGGSTSAYPLPQPIAQKPGLSGLASAGVNSSFASQTAGIGHSMAGQPQVLGHRIHSLPHTPHQQHPHQHLGPMQIQQQQQHQQQHHTQQHHHHQQQQQQQQQLQHVLLTRDAMMYGTPPPSLLNIAPSVAGPQMLYRGTPKSATAAMESPGSSSRSIILEEFRNNKTRKYELKDICEHMVEFSCDQHGSRFIQQKLEMATLEEKELVFQEVMPSSLQLMTDVFGNYVIQKFFEHGSQVQKHMLAKQMEGHILTLSLQMYGCRVVQKALEHLLTEQQASMVRELDGHVLQCVKDQNGNHVIQKAIERIPVEHIRFIIDSFHGQVYSLATHPYGCRVIQRMFEHCEDSQTRPLLDELHRYTTNLVQDQYGNYVIQHVMERGKAVDRGLVCSRVRGHVLQLSKHKFASNVVEKCIAYGEPKDRKALIDEITAVRRDGSSNLVYMMKDQYANYVVQKMLDVVDDQQRELILTKIQAHMAALRKFTYGKHLISKVEKFLAAKENSSASPQQQHPSSSPALPLAVNNDEEQQQQPISATTPNAATSKSSA
ncbi:mRNA binding protein puf3 [Coemansia erecta]|nr:mRNA binding protein puf3 [Coemansia erecta]